MQMPGPTELIIIFLIAALLFGGRRLPELGASFGRGIRNFKDALSGKTAEDPGKNEAG